MTNDGQTQDGAVHTVPHEDRTIRFVGTQLAHASSFAPGKTRWAELEVYRTVQGRYVVAGAGITTQPDERDRRWATVCRDAACVVERLHRVDATGERYLPHVAKRVLEEAASHDAHLHDAYAVETIE